MPLLAQCHAGLSEPDSAITPPPAGEPLLQALGLGPDAWGSGKAMLDLTLRDLDPGQARAALLLLFRHCEAAGVQCGSGACAVLHSTLPPLS